MFLGSFIFELRERAGCTTFTTELRRRRYAGWVGAAQRTLEGPTRLTGRAAYFVFLWNGRFCMILLSVDGGQC